MVTFAADKLREQIKMQLRQVARIDATVRDEAEALSLVLREPEVLETLLAMKPEQVRDALLRAQVEAEAEAGMAEVETTAQVAS